MNKISRKNWTASLNKWQKIVDNIKNPSKRRYVKGGVIGSSCGYCVQFDDCCDSCNIRDNACDFATRLFYVIYEEVNVRRTNIDWDLALKYAERILEAIKAGEVNVYE